MSGTLAWCVYCLRRLGATGRLAVAFLLLVLLFYVFVLLPAATRSEDLARASDALRARLEALAQGKVASVEAAADPLTHFYAIFPRIDVAVSSLGKIQRHARAYGLELERGDYRLIDDKTGRLVAYQADLPIKGSYVQVRQFLAATLADLPFVALEEVAFERRRISDAAVEAKVRLTLYVARDA